MFFALVFGFLTLILIWDYVAKKHRNDILKKSNIQGPQALPIIGASYVLRGRTLENSVEFLRQAVLDRGKVFAIWILNELSIMNADPKDLEIILSSQQLITKNNVYDMLAYWLGNGLLMSTGKKWHTRRKIITPTFHFKILEEFVEIFDAQSNILVEKLKGKVDGATVVDVFPLVCLTALDIIAETSMGVKINAQMKPNLGYAKSVKLVTDLIAERLRKPLWRHDFTFRLFAPKLYSIMMENIHLMQNFTKDVIQRRRETLQENFKHQSSEPEVDEFGSKKKMALLDVLLQSTVEGKPLSDEDIREEVETFMFEGHDTTTSGISFTLYLISRHPEVQAKLFQEIRDVIGDDKNTRATISELQDLQYMDCVIKESLRLYPPVPIIGRYFSEDVKINERVIPGNTHVNIPFYVVLRDPDNFSEPNEFKPERFAKGNENKINPFIYTPFSAGPRNCIGQKYAQLEMKSTISKILRHYELLPLGPEVVQSLSLILRSATGMNMGLKTRVYA